MKCLLHPLGQDYTPPDPPRVASYGFPSSILMSFLNGYLVLTTLFILCISVHQHLRSCCPCKNHASKSLLPTQPQPTPQPPHWWSFIFPGRLMSRYSNPAKTSFQTMGDNHKPESLTKQLRLDLTCYPPSMGHHSKTFVHPLSCSASASGLTTNLVPYSSWVSEFLLDGSRLPICLSCLRFSTTILCVGCTPETIECWSRFSTSFASSDCCMLYANGSHFLGIHSLICCAVASQGIASKDLVQIQKCTGAQVPYRKWCDVCIWLTQSSYVLLHILKHFSWCILIAL